MPLDGGDAEAVIAEFSRAGVNADLLAAELQHEGTAAFATSWQDPMDCIASQNAALMKAKQA